MKTCPPCHGNCNQRRTCPASKEEKTDSVIFGIIFPIVVIFVLGCVALMVRSLA